MWLQNYDWALTATYSPLQYLNVSVGLEHGGSVLRDGVVNTFFSHRDETELVFTLGGQY